MSRAESLHRLQQLDTELDAARKRGKEIDTLLKGTPALQHARSEFARAETEWHAAGALLKAIEDEVQSIDGKVHGEEQRLYAGNIHSPKEMLDVEHEMAALKKRRTGMDDSLMAAMERAEQAKADLAMCKAALDHAERNFNQDNVHLREEWNRMAVTVRAKLEQRQALSAALPKADLDCITDCATRKSNGVAVAMIRAGACSQCGTSPHLRRCSRRAPAARRRFAPIAGAFCMLRDAVFGRALGCGQRLYPHQRRTLFGQGEQHAGVHERASSRLHRFIFTQPLQLVACCRHSTRARQTRAAARRRAGDTRTEHARSHLASRIETPPSGRRCHRGVADR